MLHLISFVSQVSDYLERHYGDDWFRIESTIVIRPEVGRRIYWTMVSVDTFALVGATVRVVDASLAMSKRSFLNLRQI